MTSFPGIRRVVCIHLEGPACAVFCQVMGQGETVGDGGLRRSVLEVGVNGGLEGCVGGGGGLGSGGVGVNRGVSGGV